MKGLVSWFIDNPIAANILMLVLLIGGWMGYQNIKKEPFPTPDLSRINISMIYPGAAPTEVEQQIVIRIEEAIANLPGIFAINSVAREGIAQVFIEVIEGFDAKVVLSDVKARVDAIVTFPTSAERPIISQAQPRQTLTWFAIWGDIDMHSLKKLAYKIRDDMSLLEGVSEVLIYGLKSDEVKIEVSEETLRQYKLRMSDVAAAIRANSMNVPAGTIRSREGNILIQTRAQAYTGEDFSDIVIRSNPDGSSLLLSDIATIIDGFSEQELEFKVNNQSGLNFEVKLSDDPKLIEGTQNVRDYIDELTKTLPDGLNLKINFEMKSMYDGRFDLLKDNAFSGLVLVFIILMLFLRPLLAFWVVTGIAVSFAGAFWLLPSFGVSLNMLSMFAFLMVLGIVVDDAIIVGESIYHKQQMGLVGKESSLSGTLSVLKPVILAVLSTIIFFTPMLQVPSAVAPYTVAIFFVVFLCLVFSLVECLLILPSHLSHMREERKSTNPLLRRLEQLRAVFADGMEKFSQVIYKKALNRALMRPGVVVISFILVFCIFLSLLISGWVKTQFFPRPPQPFIMINATYAEGAPYSYSVSLADYMIRKVNELGEDENLLADNQGNPFIDEMNTTTNANSLQMFIGLTPPEERDISVDVISQRLKEVIGPLPELQSFSLQFSQGGGGSDIQLNLRLSSNLVDDQKQAVEDVISVLNAYPGVSNARSNLETGRLEIELELKDSAENLGITMAMVANQVRQSFYGEEVQRIPRSKEDVRVMLRYPLEQRSSLSTLEDIRIRTASGKEVPLETVADIKLVPGASTIRRTDRSRNITITADVADGYDANNIIQTMLNDYHQIWQQKHWGFELSTDGNLRAQEEFGDNFNVTFPLAALVTIALFAIALRSFVEPFLIISAVPFGFVGAILGHLLFGHMLSMMSIFGFLACSGVVVNDNLVLMQRVNVLREKGMSGFEAALQAGVDRFRPIVLTSLTTFASLLPIMFERSFQAQFLIPMVIALGFGVIVSTFVTLFMVPCLYFMTDNMKLRVKSLFGRLVTN